MRCCQSIESCQSGISRKLKDGIRREYTQGRGLGNRKRVCQGIDAGRIMGVDFWKDSVFNAVKIRFIAVKASTGAFSYRMICGLIPSKKTSAIPAENGTVYSDQPVDVIRKHRSILSLDGMLMYCQWNALYEYFRKNAIENQSFKFHYAATKRFFSSGNVFFCPKHLFPATGSSP